MHILNILNCPFVLTHNFFEHVFRLPLFNTLVSVIRVHFE